MATRTITHMYDTYDEATRAVDALRAAGVAEADISVVGNSDTRVVTPGGIGAADGMGGTGVPMTDTLTGSQTLADAPLAHHTLAQPNGHAAPRDATAVPVERTASGAGTGATVGTVLGGGAGLLAGIGALAIPGIGPVVAAGWLIATLTGAGAGAAAGGLLGALTGAGVSDSDARVYEEGVRRGGTLLSVRTTDADASRIEDILGGTGAVDLEERDRAYRAGGWNPVDPAVPGTLPHDIDARTRTPLV